MILISTYVRTLYCTNIFHRNYQSLFFERVNQFLKMKGEESDRINSGNSDKILSDLEAVYSRSRATNSNTWLTYLDSCYIYLYRGGGDPNATIASFDLDGTIIKPKNPRHKICKGASDWQFFSAWSKVNISKSVTQPKTRRLIIFTNQNGVGLNIVPLSEVKSRIESVTKSINIPCTVFVATEKDEFRKPKTKMFWLLEKCFNDHLTVERESSFYCGDAIGYPSHSDADIKFAEALGLQFITPEKFVRGHKPKFID